MKKVYFTQRAMAYLIDSIIIFFAVSLLLWLIGLFVPRNAKVEEAVESFTTAYEELLTNPNEENMLSFYEEQNKNIYIAEKDTVIELVLTLIIDIAYFGAFQFMNKGQTLGKKLMKLKVVSDDDKNYSYGISILRTCLTYNLFSSAILSLILVICSAETFLIPYGIISLVSYTFRLITILMAAFRKDGRSLPDIICHTRVTNA